mmetsp:Transcript_93605/g.292779  ORF Transcript_93605/g.292779 Transcript_93605/m.292779 type:complete len:236 (-) Transcript_93605:64-771(-)
MQRTTPGSPSARERGTGSSRSTRKSTNSFANLIAYPVRGSRSSYVSFPSNPAEEVRGRQSSRSGSWSSYFSPSGAPARSADSSLSGSPTQSSAEKSPGGSSRRAALWSAFRWPGSAAAAAMLTCRRSQATWRERRTRRRAVRPVPSPGGPRRWRPAPEPHGPAVATPSKRHPSRGEGAGQRPSRSSSGEASISRGKEGHRHSEDCSALSSAWPQKAPPAACASEHIRKSPCDPRA